MLKTTVRHSVRERVGARLLVVVVLAPVLVTACGGGGDSAGGEAEAPIDYSSYTGSVIALPETVVVVASQSEAEATRQRADALAYSDEFISRTDVYHPSMRTLRIPNLLLCEMEQAVHPAMLNRGPYLAVVDRGACAVNDSLGASNSEVEGQQQDEPEQAVYRWIVEATRKDDSSPQRIKAYAIAGSGLDWLDYSDRVIELTQYSAPTPEFSNGAFTLNYVDVYSGLANASIYYGAREMGALQVKLLGGDEEIGFVARRGDRMRREWELPDPYSWDVARADPASTRSVDSYQYLYDEEKVQIRRSLSEAGTSYLLSQQESDVDSGRFRAAFDDQVFRVESEQVSGEALVAGETQCLGRQDTVLEVSSYQVTDASGQAASVAPYLVGVEAVNGEPVSGYLSPNTASIRVGTSGVETEPVSLFQGDRLTLDGFDDLGALDFTLGVSPGRLSLVRRRSANVLDFSGSDLSWYGVPPASVCADYCPRFLSERFRAVIGSDGELMLTHRLPSFSAEIVLSTPIRLSGTDSGDDYWLSSGGYGGLVDIRYRVGSSVIEYGVLRELAPDDPELANGLRLDCYHDCPRADVWVTTAGVTTYADGPLRRYRLQGHLGGFTLIDLNGSGEQPVALADNYALDAMMIPAVESPLSSMTKLQVNALSKVFRWDANRPTYTLVDSSLQQTALIRAAPQLYQYSAGDDENLSPTAQYHPHGSVHAFQLHRWGLFGLPHSYTRECLFDRSVACDWTPLLNLRDGVTFGEFDQWQVRAESRVIKMQEVQDQQLCSHLDLDEFAGVDGFDGGAALGAWDPPFEEMNKHLHLLNTPASVDRGELVRQD